MPQRGKSALMLAAEKGHTETAAFLVEQGADIQARDWVRSDFLVSSFSFCVYSFFYNFVFVFHYLCV